MAKFQLSAIQHPENPDLYRIEALKDFGDVLIGDLGGYVDSEDRLDQSGDCWIDEDAIVCDSAFVTGFATIEGEAIICGDSFISGDAIVGGKAVFLSGGIDQYETAPETTTHYI